MNFQGCNAINRSFTVTEDGIIACMLTEKLVKNSLQRAYIFTNLFFYDIVMREIDKLCTKIKKAHEIVVRSSDFAPDDVDRIFPNVSARFQSELGNNSLDPLIKSELGKIKPTMMLTLTKDEQKKIDQMKSSIFNTEVSKFKKALIITQDNKGKPYEISLSEKYVNNLPERSRRFLKPTIKMLAYMDGLQFATFEISPTYKITYTWSNNHNTFEEEPLKDAIKAIMTPGGDTDEQPSEF